MKAPKNRAELETTARRCMGPGPVACRCGSVRPWGYTCGRCGITINEAWVRTVQGENEAKAQSALHDAALDLLIALKRTLYVISGSPVNEALVRDVKAAIAKAAGLGRR